MGQAIHRLRFEAFGCAAQVESDDRELLERVPDILPPGWQRWAGPVGVRFCVFRSGLLTVDGVAVAEYDEREVVLLALEAVIRRHVALHAPEYLFIHAGVVVMNRSTIVIPGESQSGKTTLVAELLRAGASYYSDEYAVVDRAGYVHAYARPLSIRREELAGGARLVPVPDSMIGHDPVKVALVAVTEYRAGARWDPRTCSRAEGALALMRHTVAAGRRPSDTLRMAYQLAAGSETIAGPRGEAREVAHRLLHRLTQADR